MRIVRIIAFTLTIATIVIAGEGFWVSAAKPFEDFQKQLDSGYASVLPADDHYYRFESHSGFETDSLGFAHLNKDGDVTQVPLPTGGRGASFPQGFDLGFNLAAAEFNHTGRLSALIEPQITPPSFTIEAFIHVDMLNSCQVIAESLLFRRRWALKVCDAAPNTPEVAPGQLIMTFAGIWDINSGLVIRDGFDYYVAAAQRLTSPGGGGEGLCGGISYFDIVFWAKNLTTGENLQTALNTRQEVYCAAFGQVPLRIGDEFEGLIDEVRYSDRLLDESELLVNQVQTNSDVDSDGIDNRNDNCVGVSNPDQRDTNNDGFGNACDPDINNDGIVNFADISLWVPYFNKPNAGDEDFNGDGHANFGDYALFGQYFLLPPGPGALVL